MSRATRSFLLAIVAFAAATWMLCHPRRVGPTAVKVTPNRTAPGTARR